MKALFVGDVHNHQYIFDDIKRLDNKYHFNKIVFVGDYVDDWNTDNHTSLITLNKLLELKDNEPEKYMLCLGNHEFSYLGYPCSGHNFELDKLLTQKLTENLDKFEMYVQINLGDSQFICTHSGIVNDYANKILDGTNYLTVLKEMNEHKKDYLSLLTYCSYYRGGNSPFSSFIWADRNEMFKSSENDGLIVKNQIVGHSPVTTISNYVVDNDSVIYFCDTHSTYKDGSNYGDKTYLMYDENEFKIIN